MCLHVYLLILILRAFNNLTCKTNSYMALKFHVWDTWKNVKYLNHLNIWWPFSKLKPCMERITEFQEHNFYETVLHLISDCHELKLRNCFPKIWMVMSFHNIKKTLSMVRSGEGEGEEWTTPIFQSISFACIKTLLFYANLKPNDPVFHYSPQQVAPFFKIST